MKHRHFLQLSVACIVLGSVLVGSADASYNGRIKVYVVEPTSRFLDRGGTPFDYGFLDYAVDEVISIEEGMVWERTTTWEAGPHGFTGAESDNIMAIAAVFNGQAVQGDASPPFGFFFDAYYVDAAAAATPGTVGSNTVAEGFTHTVFGEKGTATW